MARQEFSKPVKVEIIKRATRENGEAYCEMCGLPTKRFHIDHIDPDALKIDKKRKLTAKDGQLLCAGSRETCHGLKTAEQDIPAIARAKRREAKDLRARVAPARPIVSAPLPKTPKAAARVSKEPLPPRQMFKD